LPIGFNLLLSSVGLSLSDVRLLRHQEASRPGTSPYELWRDRRDVFEQYQARQRVTNAHMFGDAKHWASFVVTPEGKTLFVGIYRVDGRRLLEVDSPLFNAVGTDLAGTCHTYELALTEHHSDLIGRLVVDWGPGFRRWVQRPDNQDKPIVEVYREFREPDFPGYQEFLEPLSRIPSLPASWAQALRLARGIYVLTCPKTKEQYVGAAYGMDGFFGRWLEYATTGHGGNVALKSREPGDYQVAILEVAGSTASVEDVQKLEARWKDKLRSREMGLN
jgi:hypothetical protein